MSAPLCPSLMRHRWHRSSRIGCQENPGVEDYGNGKMLFLDVCARCGMERRRFRSYCGIARDNKTLYVTAENVRRELRDVEEILARAQAR